jgi:predicted CXXCH cytochrome family protein
MKKTFIMVVLVVLTATSALALSVVGSRHDMVFSGFATGTGGSTEVCIFCHTPHGGQTSVTLAPLWNNTLAESVNATMYTSTTMNFVTDQDKINATDARLCLSCHDSGVGMPVNQPNSGNMEATTQLMSATARLGTDMSNDHPIGMDLGPNPESTDIRYDGEANIHTIPEIIGATGFNENPFYGLNNTMWCSTCHDVHDNVNAPFLRKNNVGSALCKACHIK